MVKNLENFRGGPEKRWTLVIFFKNQGVLGNGEKLGNFSSVLDKL